MDGIEKIIGRIREDCTDQVGRIRAEGEENVRKILEAARQEAEERANDILSRGRKAAGEKTGMLVRVAELDARKNILAQRQNLIDQAFSAAVDQIKALPKEKYIELLAGMATQAAPDGVGELLLCSKDRNEVGEQVVAAANTRLGGGRLTLSGNVCEDSTGLTVRRGDVDTNCGIDMLVRLSRSELSAQVAKLLFE
ncbi:MAG: hypothetical protein IKE62_00670 [Oscillospiraceae bacterium]|nr:hypothetical protein [Oscillospiraceae bacterium]